MNIVLATNISRKVTGHLKNKITACVCVCVCYLDVYTVDSTADGVQGGNVSHRSRLVVATETGKLSV